MKALLIDHDDSFTYNLRQWLTPMCNEVVVKNHLDLSELPASKLVVLSPGPLGPQNYPHTLDLLQKLPPETFVFGVCLGLQIMVEGSGGVVESYSPPLHGKKSKLTSELAVNGLLVARYHSLKCVPGADFEILATAADDGAPMWLRHKTKRWMGVQFHPESFLSEQAGLHLQALAQWVKA